MKFELVEPPEPAPTPQAEHEVTRPEDTAEPSDPIAGLHAVTRAFTADVAAEAERIEESLSEVWSVVQSAGGIGAPYEESPPDSFQPGRFGRTPDEGNGAHGGL